MSGSSRSDQFLEELQNQYDIARVEYGIAKVGIKNKGARHWRWYLAGCVFVSAYIFLIILGFLLPELSKILSAKLFRLHTKFYFYCVGLKTEKKPFYSQDLAAGTLLLTTRADDWKVLFLFAQHKQLIIIPNAFGFFKKFKTKQIMWRLMARCLNSLSYPDQIFEKQQERLQHLLDKGYVVLAYLNEGRHYAPYNKTIYFDKQVLPFLEKQRRRKKAVFCINVKNWQVRGMASFKEPFPIDIEFISLDLLYQLKVSKNKKSSIDFQKNYALAHFFGFKSYDLLL